MTNQNKLSRREAIKILGAATGASLLANIPAKWSKPEVTGSQLPAFAQTSCGVGLVISFTPSNGGIPLLEYVYGPAADVVQNNVYTWSTAQCECLAIRLGNSNNNLSYVDWDITLGGQLVEQNGVASSINGIRAYGFNLTTGAWTGPHTSDNQLTGYLPGIGCPLIIFPE